MLSLGFLDVCPIHVHLLLLSRTSANSWSIAFHNSTLLILSYHLIPRILLSDLFINTWILLVSAFVHVQVSELYNNNCFTLELNSLNFVLLQYTFDVPHFVHHSKGYSREYLHYVNVHSSSQVLFFYRMRPIQVIPLRLRIFISP